MRRRNALRSLAAAMLGTFSSAWLPGCRQARWEGEGRVIAEVSQSVAHLKADFRFDLEVAERTPPTRLVLRGTGEGLSISSGVTVEVEIDLEAAEGNATEVRYRSTVGLSGPLAKVGEAVLKLKARQVQKEMAANVKAALEG